MSTNSKQAIKEDSSSSFVISYDNEESVASQSDYSKLESTSNVTEDRNASELTENLEKVAYILTEYKDNQAPFIIESEGEEASILTEKKDNGQSHKLETEENVADDASFIIVKVDKESSISKQKRDGEASFLIEFDDKVSSVSKEKKDCEASFVIESKCKMASILTEKKDDAAIFMTENNDMVASITKENKNNDAPFMIKSEENVSSILPKSNDETSPVIMNDFQDDIFPSIVAQRVSDKESSSTKRKNYKLSILTKNNDKMPSITITEDRNILTSILSEPINIAKPNLTQSQNQESSSMTQVNYETVSILTKDKNEKDEQNITLTQNKKHKPFVQNDNDQALTLAQNIDQTVSSFCENKDKFHYCVDKIRGLEVSNMTQSNDEGTSNLTRNKEREPILISRKESEDLIYIDRPIKSSTSASQEIGISDNAPDTKICIRKSEETKSRTTHSASDSKLNINFQRCVILMPTSVNPIPQVMPKDNKVSDIFKEFTLKQKINTKTSNQKPDKNFAWDPNKFLSLRSSQWDEWAKQKRNFMFGTPERSILGTSKSKNDVTVLPRANNIQSCTRDVFDQDISNEITPKPETTVHEESILSTNTDGEINFHNTNELRSTQLKGSGKINIYAEIINESNKILAATTSNAVKHNTFYSNDSRFSVTNTGNDNTAFNKMNQIPTKSFNMLLFYAMITKILHTPTKVKVASNFTETKDKKASFSTQSEDLTRNSTSVQVLTLIDASHFIETFDKGIMTFDWESSKDVNARPLNLNKETSIFIQNIERETSVQIESKDETTSITKLNNTAVASELSFSKLHSKLKTVEKGTRVWFQSKDEMTASNDKVASNASVINSEEHFRINKELKPTLGTDNVKIIQKIVDGKETSAHDNVSNGAFKITVSQPAPSNPVINEFSGKKFKKLFRKTKILIGFFTKLPKGNDKARSNDGSRYR